MTQVGEGVAILVEAMADDDNNKSCDFRPEDKSWKCNLSGSSDVLAGNLGSKPNASCKSELTSADWPSQAHHLIPHLTLIEHDVADLLKVGEELYGDTNYDVDHNNNGKWMPYASSLDEWVTKATKASDRDSNRQLMFKVMGLAQIQLHQGRHSSSNKYGVGEVPYKKRVLQYLDKISNNGFSHFSDPFKCDACNDKEVEDKHPPRENTVRYVDKASELIEKDVNNCRIFVSKIAAEFAETEGFSL